MNKYTILKEYFGHSSFRDGQEGLIDAVLLGRDALGIMPTGAGKSMCYQIPALLMSGVTIVVSPLISLMKDQVNALIQSGVKAAYLNSSLTSAQYEIALRNARNGMYKIIYVAPERLCTQGFINFAQTVKISIIAVDEAHCVSQWGQDFRPSYMKIPEFIQAINYRPIIAAFTATATSIVKDDIVKLLNLNNPYSITTGFDRKNLYFEVQKPDEKFSAALEIIERNKDKNGIIYCSTRKNVEDVCQKLCDRGYSASRYHAGLSDNERHINQDDFIYDRIQIMVATNAFGMGIDKSNVSYVIHYNMPKNIESYYQEAGRAGRDGEPAECVLLYGGRDVRTNTFLIENSNDNSELDEETLVEIRKRDLERLKQMTFYSTTTDCLREFILNYFGEKTHSFCSNCSNCNTNFVENDITIEAQKILSCIFRLSQRNQSFGAAMIADILKGSKNARIASFGLDTLSTYGIMSDITTIKIRKITDFLEQNDYIKRLGEHSVLALTAKAKDILIDKQQLTMKMPKEKEKTKAKHISDGIYSIDTTLLNKLKTLRTKLASDAQMPAYIIFTDTALRDICVKLPRTESQLLDCSGVGKTKLERYGAQVLKVVNDYINENPSILNDEGSNSYLNRLRKNRGDNNFVSMLFKVFRDSAGKLYANDDDFTLSYLCDQFLEQIEISADKKIISSTIENWLISKNYLSRFGEKSNEVSITNTSREIGIVEVQTISKAGGVYKSIKFSQNAQQFIIDNINDIFKHND